MQFKSTQVLELVNQLRADPAINWHVIVESANWILPPGDSSGQSVQWLDAAKDLRERLREWVAASSDVDPKRPVWLLGCIAAAERWVGKPLNTLRKTNEFKVAFEAFGVHRPELFSRCCAVIGSRENRFVKYSSMYGDTRTCRPSGRPICGGMHSRQRDS